MRLLMLYDDEQDDDGSVGLRGSDVERHEESAQNTSQYSKRQGLLAQQEIHAPYESTEGYLTN